MENCKENTPGDDEPSNPATSRNLPNTGSLDKGTYEDKPSSEALPNDP